MNYAISPKPTRMLACGSAGYCQFWQGLSTSLANPSSHSPVTGFAKS